MMGRGWASVALALLAITGLVSVSAAARTTAGTPAPALFEVELVLPPGADTLESVTPTLIVRVRDPQSVDRPFVLGLQIAFTPGFTGQLLVDTTVTADTAAIALRRPLPSGATVFVRASARSINGDLVFSPSAQRVVPSWLTLISPNDLNGSTLETQRPRFVWRSAAISSPPGPWLYDLQIRNVGSGQILSYAGLSDTSFVPPVATSGLPLDFNTSYRWSVTARLSSGESATVQSRSSFVILNPAIPLATLLYQNFPNPFPTATSPSTCVWFDLSTPATVSLDVFDLSGRHVVNIVPGRSGSTSYPAGRHGRVPAGSSPVWCNGNIQWDGRGRDGRFAPPGVYLLRLRAGRVESVKKIVFREHP